MIVPFLHDILKVSVVMKDFNHKLFQSVEVLEVKDFVNCWIELIFGDVKAFFFFLPVSLQGEQG